MLNSSCWGSDHHRLVTHHAPSGVADSSAVVVVVAVPAPCQACRLSAAMRATAMHAAPADFVRAWSNGRHCGVTGYGVLSFIDMPLCAVLSLLGGM